MAHPSSFGRKGSKTLHDAQYARLGSRVNGVQKAAVVDSVVKDRLGEFTRAKARVRPKRVDSSNQG